MSIDQVITELQERKAPTFQVGDFMWVETEVYGLQLGQIISIGKSPFYGEENLDAAYVGSLPGQPCWTTYILGEVQ